jgi:hypothetical protein
MPVLSFDTCSPTPLAQGSAPFLFPYVISEWPNRWSSRYSVWLSVKAAVNYVPIIPATYTFRLEYARFFRTSLALPCAHCSLKVPASPYSKHRRSASRPQLGVSLLRTRVIRTHPLTRPPLDVPSPRVFPAEVSPAHALEAACASARRGW